MRGIGASIEQASGDDCLADRDAIHDEWLGLSGRMTDSVGLWRRAAAPETRV